MDRHDFDDLAKAFGQGSNRRAVLKRALGGVLGGALVLRGSAAQRASAGTCRVLAESCDREASDCCEGLSCVENPENSNRTACMPTPEGDGPGTPPPPPSPTIRQKRCRDCERRCWHGKPLAGHRRNRHLVCRRRCANICRKR